MIPRYSRAEMASVWGDEARLRFWCEIEVLACEARAARGDVPVEDARSIRARARVDAAAVSEREAVTQHDLAAFVDVVQDSIGAAGRHLHWGLTSSDVVDTALGAQLRDAGRILLDGIGGLQTVLGRRADEFRHTPMVGRTHGIHAEPITFGLKLLVAEAEMRRARARVGAAVAGVAVGKLSGAVGTFAHLDPDIEAEVCRRFGVRPDPVATQIVARDRHAAFLVQLALLGASLERLAVEIRHLQRTEVGEAEEPFARGQKGSSSMPHKRNPIRSERIVGLARLLRGYAVAGLENVALWHERDISHSSVERVILPDACLAADYALDLMTRTVDGLVVYPERMRANLAATRGLVFSGTLLLQLVAGGMQRDEAYGLVQTASRAVVEGRGTLRDVALATPALRDRLAPGVLERVFDLDHHLRHVDAIFARVRNEEPA